MKIMILLVNKIYVRGNWSKESLDAAIIAFPK